MGRSWRIPQFALIILSLACAVPAQNPPAQPSRANAVVAPPPAPVSPAARALAGDTQAPVAPTSFRFAVIGDTGTGERAQYDTGTMLARSREVFPFELVIMVGDNLYGSERPQDYTRKFELPYKVLLDAKVLFYAALGNHDDPNQMLYKPFNMEGKRYYSFKRNSIRFFALDSNYMDREQIEWLTKELQASGSDWKIAFFHHPLYSSGGTHGSEVDLRAILEPLFLEHGVNVVFAGHEHFYERIQPQKGIHYFTAGGSAKLRQGDIRKTALTALGYDSDNTYMLIEIAGDTMHFQTLNRAGKRIDGGSFSRAKAAPTR